MKGLFANTSLSTWLLAGLMTSIAGAAQAAAAT